jgi:protein-S-isoprenylcysteine O-methyltransferase Ste14
VYLTVAAIGVKRELEEHLGQSIGLLFAIVAAFALPHLPIFSFVNFAPMNAVASTVGVILCVAGTTFLVWGRQHLGTNWSQTVAVKEGHALVTSGSYRYVRHPIYIRAGFLPRSVRRSLRAAGGCSYSSSLATSSSARWRRRPPDGAAIPEQVPDYKRRTKALIPFVW